MNDNTATSTSSTTAGRVRVPLPFEPDAIIDYGGRRLLVCMDDKERARVLIGNGHWPIQPEPPYTFAWCIFGVGDFWLCLATCNKGCPDGDDGYTMIAVFVPEWPDSKAVSAVFAEYVNAGMLPGSDHKFIVKDVAAS